MLKVFQADTSDLQWMYRLLVQASNKGHFLVDNNKQGREWVKGNLYSIVVNNRRIDEDLQAQTLVFEDEKGTRVGFAIMSEIENGFGNEIYVLVVDKEQRGKGFGRHMLNEIIERWHPYSSIIARVHPVSKVMANMLRNSGFVVEKKLEHDAEVYCLEKLQPAILINN